MALKHQIEIGRGRNDGGVIAAEFELSGARGMSLPPRLPLSGRTGLLRAQHLGALPSVGGESTGPIPVDDPWGGSRARIAEPLRCDPG
jgi:hypothetical protein